jgi:hypothetical protein
MSSVPIGLAVAVAVLLVLVAMSVRIVNEYERGVIFRLGRVIGAKGPGLFFIIPVVDRMVKVSLRTVTMDIPPQDVITRDNVTVRVNAVTYFNVVDPVRSVVAIENYLFGTSQVAQTTLRSILGQVDLDELLIKRDDINQRLQKIIDQLTDAWGVKVTLVEVKDVELPETMRRAMASQAEAERDRRAKVIHAASVSPPAAPALVGCRQTPIAPPPRRGRRRERRDDRPAPCGRRLQGLGQPRPGLIAASHRPASHGPATQNVQRHDHVRIWPVGLPLAEWPAVDGGMPTGKDARYP